MKFKDFVIKEVKPKIYCLEFKDQLKMCLHFLRYQEFYESPNPKFRNKPFELIDFIEWYTRNSGTNGLTFDYANHWIGFNIPSKVFHKALYPDDYNKYDTIMAAVADELVLKSNHHDYYLIGAMAGNERTIQHEVAHGFFYTVPEYKKKMSKLVSELKPKFRKDLFESLTKLGYTKEVLVDEAQAFLSTGWRDYFKPKLVKQDEPFVKVFQEFNLKITL